MYNPSDTASALRAFVEPLMAQKLQHLRLLEGLDATRVVPAEHAGFPIALAQLITFDQMASVLIQAGPDGDPELVASAGELVTSCSVARQELLETLPPALRLRVLGAAAQSKVKESQVEAELKAELAAQREAGLPPGRGDDESDLASLSEEIERMAGVLSAYVAPTTSDERVERQEAKPLPLSRCVDDWLKRLPVGWLRGIATCYDVPPRQKKAVLVSDITERLLDPEALRLALARDLDEVDRVFLGELVARGDIGGEAFDSGFAEAVRVPWDWILVEPAVLPPGRLRALGLAFVGRRDGSPHFAMPVELQQPVAQALLPLLREAAVAVDPDVLEGLGIVAAGNPYELAYSFDEPSRGPAVLDSSGPESILELEVTLHVEPRVRRRILVSSRRSLGSLHGILQRAFGWEDYHLHLFNSPDTGEDYGSPNSPIDEGEPCLNEWETAVGELLQPGSSRLTYEYDFGDDWQHDIRCVAHHATGSTPHEPHCLSGEGACPPEDVGGRYGYANYLQALVDSDHPDHEMLTRWRGPGFDPTQFDLDAVNARLAGMALTTDP